MSRLKQTEGLSLVPVGPDPQALQYGSEPALRFSELGAACREETDRPDLVPVIGIRLQPAEERLTLCTAGHFRVACLCRLAHGLAAYQLADRPRVCTLESG